MWYGLRMSSRAGPDFASPTRELLQSTLRHIVLITGGVYVAWQLVAAVTWPDTVGWNGWPIIPGVVLASVLSLWLLPKQLLAALIAWQLGLAAAITFTIYVFQRPEIAFFYALLPLMAVIILNWPAGLLAEGLVIALVRWLSHSSILPPLSTPLGLVIIVGGTFTGLLGWGVTHSLLTATQWSLFSFEQARQKMEEAREQRLELKQIQEDLIQANRELARLSDRLKVMHQAAEEARQAKEEFVANVSHELRTPLNMIIGFSEMITELPQVYGDKVPSALLADIAAIQRNSQHLAKLVDDVLDLSQVEAERMALSKEWVALPEIVGEATLAVRALFESKGLYLEMEIPSDLPLIFCDGTRIRQVVLNLLSNAGRFTERGRVRIKAWREQNDLVISVSDTGPGIAQADQKRVFEPFQQLDSSIRRRHGGSGLGLSISRRFVEMHRGKMWLESQVGVGTTFYFSLPLETPLPAALAGDDDARRWFHPDRQYEPRARRPKAPPPMVIPRFILMESGDTLSQLFSRYLDNAEIVSIRDVEDAVYELSRSPVRALIVNTPLLKEIPAPLEKLTNLSYGTPAIACWVPGEGEATKRLGVVRYLVKPITRQALLSTLQELGEEVRDVLLVDDDPEVLQLFARMLDSAKPSYRVLQATNGQRALYLLRERQPDVMLLDLIMPGMDGFQVLQEKSQDTAIRKIPVVVISSRDPSGEPIVSDALTVTRSGGLSVRDLLACIQAVSEVLSPSSVRPDNREQPEKPAA